jgi:heme-degrading monooxygenase HmoA
VIVRLWHSCSRPDAADAYERLLREELSGGIAARAILGYRGIELFRRRADGGTVEFVTLMRFDSLDAVREFAGPDYETAVVPPAARTLLLRYDARSTHYEVRDSGEHRG